MMPKQQYFIDINNNTVIKFLIYYSVNAHEIMWILYVFLENINGF